jgi:hypothetical protein
MTAAESASPVKKRAQGHMRCGLVTEKSGPMATTRRHEERTAGRNHRRKAAIYRVATKIFFAVAFTD